MGGLTALRDDELARLAAAGDRGAFGELMRRHAPVARALLRRMGAQPALADDVAQDACLKAFERIGTYRNEGSFSGWLQRIAARLYIRRWQKEGRFDLCAEPLDEETADVARASGPGESMDLDRALQSLNTAERMCISLCIGVGLTHGEAAEELRIPLGTVKSHVHRGLVKLRARFEVKADVRKEMSRVRA